MNNQMKHYSYYEAIMKIDLDEHVVKTSDFKSFSKLYPNIAESIRLKRKVDRLSNLLKYDKYREAQFEIKREIALTKTKLKKINLFKRLHGENKQENVFRRRFRRNTSKIRYSFLIKKFKSFLGQSKRKVIMKLRKSMNKNLPPTLFNLRELAVSEKWFALKEWLEEKSNDLEKSLT